MNMSINTTLKVPAQKLTFDALQEVPQDLKDEWQDQPPQVQDLSRLTLPLQSAQN